MNLIKFSSHAIEIKSFANQFLLINGWSANFNHINHWANKSRVVHSQLKCVMSSKRFYYCFILVSGIYTGLKKNRKNEKKKIVNVHYRTYFVYNELFVILYLASYARIFTGHKSWVRQQLSIIISVPNLLNW